jgi:SHOCT-like domain
MNTTEMPVVVVDEKARITAEGENRDMSEETKQILSMLAEGKVSVEEAERLIAALGEEETAGEKSETPSRTGKAPRYLRVLVEDGNESVNIRVPLGLVKAGMKLKALLPEKARKKIDDKFSEKGIDLGKVGANELDEILSSLGELHVDVNGGSKEKVRIFCE